MGKKLSKTLVVKERRPRRSYPPELREEAVQMLLDGHSASSICDRLGLSAANLLYRWKKDLLEKGGAIAVNRDSRVRELELELRRVERERDILKKALVIFGRES